MNQHLGETVQEQIVKKVKLISLIAQYPPEMRITSKKKKEINSN